MLVPSSSIVQQQGFCPMCEAMGGWGWAAMLLMGVFWIAVIVAVVWSIARLVRGRGGGVGRSTAEDILRERYARGEIDEQTYHRMRSELEH